MARKKKKTREIEPVVEREDEPEGSKPSEPPADELGDESAPTDLPALAEEEPETEVLAPVPTERSLVRHDPLTAYVQEIRRYPLLSREDEHELAVQYYKTG